MEQRINPQSFARVLVEARKYGAVFPVISLDRSFQTHQFTIQNKPVRLFQVGRPQVFVLRVTTPSSGPTTFIGNAGLSSTSGWPLSGVEFLTLAIQENTELWSVNNGVIFPSDNTTVFVLEMGI